MTSFGKEIRKLRNEDGMPLRCAGKNLHMDFSALARIENEKASPSVLIHTFRWEYFNHMFGLKAKQWQSLYKLGLEAIKEWENGKKKNRQARQRDNNNTGARK